MLAEGAYLTVVCPEYNFTISFLNSETCSRSNATVRFRSSLDTQVSWKKDSITLEKGVRGSFRKLDTEVRAIVDAFGTLYLTGSVSSGSIDVPVTFQPFVYFSVYVHAVSADVSVNEEGNYSCTVDNVNAMQLKIIVVPKARLLTQGRIYPKLLRFTGAFTRTNRAYSHLSFRCTEFFRHLGYLGFIFLLCSLCYCSGVIRAYRRRDKFRAVVSAAEQQAEGSEEEIPFFIDRQR